MSINGKEPGATVKPHGTEPTKPLDGIEQIHSLSPQEAMGVIVQCLPLLIDALLSQSEAINRLAASNESLVEQLMLDVTNEGDGEPILGRYMDGSKVS